jgi:methionyl aminopeptidase
MIQHLSGQSKKAAGIVLRDARELALMREAGRIVAKVHEAMRREVRPGVSTAALDALAEEIIRSHGATPTFLGYRGYPASICTSINDEIVHGIPSPRRFLKEGDIISIDVGATYRGWVGDSAWTYPVGEISQEAQALLEATEGALWAGIRAARAGNRLGDISAAIQAHVEARGFSVIREYGGHGVGRAMHEPPRILNYGRPGTGLRLRPGMTFALEPMVAAGHWLTRVDDDGWTVRTQDGSLSAHFEHTLAVTDGDPMIMTIR